MKDFMSDCGCIAYIDYINNLSKIDDTDCKYRQLLRSSVNRFKGEASEKDIKFVIDESKRLDIK